MVHLLPENSYLICFENNPKLPSIKAGHDGDTYYSINIFLSVTDPEVQNVKGLALAAEDFFWRYGATTFILDPWGFS